MHLRSATAWTVSRSQDLFSLTSMTPSLTVPAALKITSRYPSVIAAVAFWWAIVVIVPFVFLFAFIIWMWAGAFLWQSVLMIADGISWSILLGIGSPSSLGKVRCLSAMLDPDVREGPGPADVLRLGVRGSTVFYLLSGVRVIFDSGSCFCSDCYLSCSLGLGFSRCCSWHFSGSPPCIAPACCVASTTSRSCLVVSFLSSFPAL